MDISVIVCTYNRSESLTKCLSHLEGLEVPKGVKWEVLVVDNNSTDETAKIVRNYINRGKLPLAYVYELNQGLCYARNRGIAESSGKIVAFIDDDILAEPGWLTGMLSVFSETSCDAAGGRIHLEIDDHPMPNWFIPILWGYLGYIDHGEERIELDGMRNYPHGGNMAFRRKVFNQVGLFDVTVGRAGNKLFKGSETEFFRRLAATGAKIIYEPTARVRHIVKPKELTKRHFRILQFRNGEQRALQETIVYPRSVVGIPLFVVSVFVKMLNEYIRVFLHGPGFRSRREMDLWDLVGYAWGCYQAYRRRKLTVASTCRVMNSRNADEK